MKTLEKNNSLQLEGWRMVKSETPRDAEILVRNPSPRLFGEKFRDSKKVKANHEKTSLRDSSKTLPRFRDPAKIFRDPRFSRYHSPPLVSFAVKVKGVVSTKNITKFGRFYHIGLSFRHGKKIIARKLTSKNFIQASYYHQI